jgi:hypothetical protein
MEHRGEKSRDRRGNDRRDRRRRRDDGRKEERDADRYKKDRRGDREDRDDKRRDERREDDKKGERDADRGRKDEGDRRRGEDRKNKRGADRRARGDKAAGGGLGVNDALSNDVLQLITMAVTAALEKKGQEDELRKVALEGVRGDDREPAGEVAAVDDEGPAGVREGTIQCQVCETRRPIEETSLCVADDCRTRICNAQVCKEAHMRDVHG